MKFVIFWVATPYYLVCINRKVGKIFCFHLQGKRSLWSMSLLPKRQKITSTDFTASITCPKNALEVYYPDM
jgi:hypothetical protein